MAAPTKRKLTIAQAAEQWIDRTRRLRTLKAEREEAEAILKAYFKRTGRKTYKDRIAFAITTRVILDQPKVRAFLGRRLPRFQRESRSETLSLLGDGGDG